jgi:aryl-alcohol dehydrogenase (NADP+)
MIYQRLSGTELNVSRICLGTMTFGGQVDEQWHSPGRSLSGQRHQLLRYGKCLRVGRSEVILGKALKGRRPQVILADKVRGAMGQRPDESGLSRAAILRAVDDSLSRLQTDYLDIYYLHQPDYSVPIDETLEAIDELIKQGRCAMGRVRITAAGR